MSAYLQALRLFEEGWHGLGGTMGNGFIQPGETPTEAAKICGMNKYRYLYDALYRLENGVNATYNADGTVTLEAATLRQIGKSELAVELPDGSQRTINRIVDWYNLLQPNDLTRILDPLAKQMQLYGVGILGKDAEIMFVQFELPPYAIGEDEHRAYFTVGDDKTGGGIYQGTTHVRVVCFNTWSASISELPVFGHSDSAFTVEACAKILATTLRAREQEKALMEALFKQKFTKEERNAYAEAVFPDPVKPGKVELAEAAMVTLSAKEAEPIQERMSGVVSAYESGLDLAQSRRVHLMAEVQTFNADMPAAANTGYALFNGLTAMARPQEEVRDAEGRKMFAGDNINRLANSLFGKGVNGLAVARGRNWLAEAVK